MSELKILIVDDEPHIVILLEEVFELLEEDYGVELLTAMDGEKALALAVEHQPQLVILDVMLPKISGLAVCQGIKENPDLAGTTVILLTAKGQQFDRQAGLAVGADCYVTKPFRPRDLLAQAKEILGIDQD
ncbi:MULTISPECIES: response regulator [Synechocystis]|uniref:Response regulator n=1 Tax=Synechocystis salina LEGE 00031 TaxID=1828736 RepID=A0ABR9VUB6_9SYNC|nr:MULTISPECIES: response regulator [Synechocystis]MBD2655244.1 response regulator [Synechocystis sp. FACHB-383]MBE9242771.1 response regulator [Synechocystis salina LEGE 00041]MBE9254048.1 response regulator [Synechocystis salina LEGE 00031]